MSYYLFMDDTRKPREVDWVTLPQNVGWEIAKSYNEFVAMIMKCGIPKFVTYDCDLCDEHYSAFFNLCEKYVTEYRKFKTKCGIDCIEHMLKLCKRKGIAHPQYAIHTKNHYAEPFMKKLIQEHNKNV